MGIKLSDIEDDCDSCPLLKAELCTGGIVVTPNGYHEPPCCNMDEDTDLDEYVVDYYKRVEEGLKRRKLREEKEREKQKKLDIAKRKRNYLKSYCYKEHRVVRDLKSQIKYYEKLESKAKIRSRAFNITNEMFGYGSRVEVNPEIISKLSELKILLEEAEKVLKQKQKEGRKTDGYKSIN